MIDAARMIAAARPRASARARVITGEIFAYIRPTYIRCTIKSYGSSVARPERRDAREILLIIAVYLYTAITLLGISQRYAAPARDSSRVCEME